MAKKRLTGNNRTLSDDWEETLRQIRTQTAVDFTMTGEEKARKLRELEADPVAWAKFMFYRYAKYEFAGFQKKAHQAHHRAIPTGTRYEVAELGAVELQSPPS